MPVALGGASFAAIAALALSLTVRSLAWPVINDAVVMHYIAARLLEGAVPYRDLFDMNFPGVYLVHMLGIVLFGPSDAGFRALDLIMLVGTVAGLGVALTSFGRWASGFGVSLFWLYHLAAGPSWGAGERDFFQCLPLAWMTAAAIAYMKSGRVVTLALAGVSLGAAVCVKPFALLMAPVLMVLAWRRPSAERVTALVVLAVGFAVPVAVVLTWLASTGGLAAFLDIVGGYLPLYGVLGRRPLSELLFVPRRALTIWALVGFLGLWRAGRLDRRMLVLGSGFVYGWLNIILQGQGNGYHAYPLALFAIAVVAAGAGAALEKGKRVLSAMLQVVLLVTVARVAVDALKAPDASSIAKVLTRVHAVAAILAPVVSKGESVQVLEATSDGLIHALYLLRARQPTRFIYDYHFYHTVDHPYIQRLRAELLEGLRARPPGAVVLIEPGVSFTPRGYARLEDFPALATLLESSYRLAHEGEGYQGYRIYVPRANR